MRAIRRNGAFYQVPFGNELRLAVANGTTIKAMLEHGVKSDEPVGSFLVTDGLRFWWDPKVKLISASHPEPYCTSIYL